MTEQPDIHPLAEEKAAIKAIASSRDGALLHRYLRRVLETVIDLDSEGALREQNGRRSLARDLMRHMAEGLNDDRTDSSNAPILARSSGAVAVTGRSRRDRASYPRVDSYSDALNPDGSEPKPDAGSERAPG